MERWVEHYQEIYSNKSLVTDTTVKLTNLLSSMEELDFPLTSEKLRKAIDSLVSGKAPGIDGIPFEVIKAGKQSNILDHLYKLLLQCRQESTVLQNICDAKNIILYKSKGNRSDCNNYRGIFFLSTVKKAFASVVLNRLRLLAECVYPKAQCGFRAKRSTGKLK